MSKRLESARNLASLQAVAQARLDEASAASATADSLRARAAEASHSASLLRDRVGRLNASAFLKAFDAVVSPGLGTPLADAIAAAPEGARIFLRPGRYNEAILLDKVVHLFGGDRAACIQWEGATTVTVKSAGSPTLDGLCLRNRNGDYALDIFEGTLSVRGCDISAEPAWSSVAVQGDSDTDPLFVDCRIHSGAGL